MKRTQVALAALALMASTAALAADVTISGQIDVGVFHTGKTAAGVGGTFMEQGGLMDHSSITITANEDLGGGLKVSAVLETGFNANGAIDNGGNAGAASTGQVGLFNRQSYVSLGGEFGTIGLGKQLSPYILTAALTNGGFGTFWVPRLQVGGAGASYGPFAAGGTRDSASGFFISNAVMYTSPSFAGFSLQAMTTTPSGTRNNILNNSAASSEADKYTSYSLSGNIGPAFVAAAWQKRGDGNDLAASGDALVNGYKSWTVGATMPLVDNLSVFANYMSDKVTGAADSVSSYAGGVKYNLTAATAVQLAYSANDASGNSEMNLTNLALMHTLSKRTTLYATAGRGKNVGSAIGNWKNNYSGLTNNTYGVGVAHSF